MDRVAARQLTLLIQLESDPAGIIKATAVFTGPAGAVTGAPGDIDERSLIEELANLGRRMLGCVRHHDAATVTQ